MLWRDGNHRLADLASYARKKFMRVAVTTNGTLPFDAPVDIIWVSLDGTKESQDELRSGSFDRIRVNLLKTKHRTVLIHCTLNRLNWQGIGDLAELVKKIPAVRGMTVQLFYPYRQGEDELALIPDERRQAIERVIELKKKGFPILNSAGRLKAMIENNWRCRDDILVCRS